MYYVPATIPHVEILLQVYQTT